VLTLHDATGRCRLRRVVRGPSATVDCRGLPGGAYVARLNGADVRWQGRVLVVR
jgi:hypothetical protein